MSEQGKVARLVEAARVLSDSAPDAHKGWYRVRWELMRDMDAALDSLTPAEVALADAAEGLADAAEGLADAVVDLLREHDNGANPCGMTWDDARAALRAAGRGE